MKMLDNIGLDTQEGSLIKGAGKASPTLCSPDFFSAFIKQRFSDAAFFAFFRAGG